MGSAAPREMILAAHASLMGSLHRTHSIAEGIKASAGVSGAFVHLSEPDPVSTVDESAPVGFSRAEEGKLQLGLTAVSQGLLYGDLTTDILCLGLSPP